METKDLRLLVELSRQLHFGRTARALGLSPSGLSRRVAQLEEELGAPLLKRDPRSVTLTRQGQKALRFAEQCLTDLAALVAELREEAKEPEGDLSVACTVTACHSILPQLISVCRRRYPKISLRLTTQDAERSLEQLNSGELDLAVIPTDGSLGTKFEAQVLTHTRLMFVAPPEERRFQSGEYDLVAPIGGLERKRLDEWLRCQKKPYRIVAEVRGNEGILAMVSMGTGLALLPELVLQSSSLPFSMAQLDDPPKGYDVSLCTRKSTLQSPAVRAFFSLAKEAGQLV